MKLQCQVEVINRLHNNLNIRSSGKYLKSTLALGKEPKSEADYFILHFSSVNRTGTKYRVKCMKQVFVKCLNEGKATIRFEEPPHDLCIKSECIQLRCFMKLLKQCVTGEAKDLKVTDLSSIAVTAKDIVPTKLVIRDRSEFPAKGFPRTLDSLSLAGLKLCNFGRDILLLKHLTVLDLSNNEIEKIPPEFGRMSTLTELYLANNKLGVGTEDWRWLLGPQLSNSLKLVDLSSNGLRSLPKAVWKLRRLATLQLDHNQITQLPATLGRIQSLRYLTLSHNNLTSLPCSLLQCRLEQLDISSNQFQSNSATFQKKPHTPWDYYVGNLVQIAAKVVLKNKLFYASNIIPFTLVEFLDDANMCVCGAPVVNDVFYMIKQFDLREYFGTVVFDNFRDGRVGFVCYFCSPKCYSKINFKRKNMNLILNVIG